jgi:hypothetical protein
VRSFSADPETSFGICSIPSCCETGSLNPNRAIGRRSRQSSSMVDDVQLLPEFFTGLAQWNAPDAVHPRKQELTPTLHEYVFRPFAPLPPALRGGLAAEGCQQAVRA